MNHVFALVWNASLGCWAVTHEFSKRCRKGSRCSGKLALAALLLSTGFSSSAFATCSTAGSTVTCTGVPVLPLFLNQYSSATNGLTVNVNPGAQMNAILGGHVMDLTGVNISLNNSGTLDPALFGFVSILSGGAFIGTGATSAVSVLNNASGIMRGTGMLLGLNLTSIDGLAIGVNNAASGITSITNNGTITSTGLSTGGITLADTPVIGVYGGSQVNMTNSSTGVINGRIAFETSAAGNTFANAGRITGGVSMGAWSTNTFTALTGSSVQVGDGVHTSVGLGGLVNINLTFAPTGTVDGGVGGTNSLILQNQVGVGGGTTGDGTASSATYVNFNNLILNSGNWTLQGPLVSGATTLNGGVAQFNNNATFGSGVITSNGGILQASNAGLNISNLISLGAGGVTVQGTNATTLSGVISGSGGLTKVGTSQLNLSAANTYLGNTTLSGGTVQISNNQAFSTGTLNVTSATTLSAPGTINLANAINLGGTLTASGTGALTLGGLISASSGLTKTGTGSLTVSGANTGFSGTTTLSAGSLLVTNNNSLGSGALNTAAGTTLDSTTNVTLANNISMTGALNVLGSNALTLVGELSGTGGITKSGTASLTLTGNNSNSGNTALNAGTLLVGSNTALGTGALSAAEGTTLDASTSVTLTNAVSLGGNLNIGSSANVSLGGIVSGSGGLTKNGAANLTLNGNNSFSGGTTLNDGTLTLGSANGLGSGSLIVGRAATLDNSASLGIGNDITLNAGLTVAGNNDLSLNGIIDGAGGLTKNGLSDLTLAGNNTFTGTTAINGGTVGLSGSLASAQVNVNSGGTLTGTGSALGSVNVNSGGHLALSSGNQLSAGSLTLAAGSNVDVTLGTPSTTSLMNVGGNLTLNGNLNVSDAGGFGVGVYRLFNYTGALTNLGLDVANVPFGYGLGDLVVQTGVANQINIQVSAPNVNIRYWDGSQTIPNGVVDGGSGAWSAVGTNWTDANGLVNQSWAGDFAVFQGTAGNVTVNGTQVFTGMQFLTDGYNVVNGAAGQLTAVNGSGGTAALRVDPGVTATINANINGSGILNKLDSGTLVLGGANAYTGGTQLDGGKIIVGSNTALGTGTLTANAGTQLDSNAAVTLANAATLNGNLTVLGSNSLTLNGVIGGTGGLIKNGVANLTLSGYNAFLGPVALNSGGLILASNSALGFGTLNAAGGTALDASTAVSLNNAVNLAGNLGIVGTADLSLAGTVNGAGSLSKYGASNLTLSGYNNFLGGTTLNAGTLIVGSNSALGLGNLTVAGASALDSSSALSLGNNVVINANLSNTGSNNLTLAGVVSGTGGLIKNGTSNLTLNGINTYTGGTTVNAGTLTLGTGGSLGSGALSVAGASTLDNTAPLVLANNLNVNANLALAGNNNLTLGGIIAGAGTLTKYGLADVTLSGNNTYSGTFDALAGSLTTLSSGALGNNATVTLSVGAALNLGASASLASLTGSGTALIGTGNTLSLGGNNISSTFAGNLRGDGGLTKLGNGTLTLSGISDLTGDTLVNAGMLQVNGSLASGNVLVNNGGTLGGSGTLTGAVTVADGGHLAGVTGSTLSVDSLVFNGNSKFDVGLGTPVSGGGNGLVNVGGNLTLDGTLNVSDIGGFGSGVYRLMNYTGGLTDNGMLIGTVPGSVTPGDLTLQTALANQINLLVSVPGVTVQFWDGNQQVANGSVEGGSGTWGTGTTNWTDVNGTTNQAWTNNFAVFQGTAGTVTVNGAQTFTGMQFVTDGYTVVNGTAGQLTAVNGSGGTAALRVDPGVTATIDATINGSGILNKLDAGTLVLTGANAYTGGTQLDGGKIIVGSDTALGTGALTTNAGTQLDSNAAATLANAATLNGNLTVVGSNNLILSGDVSGAGGLIKNGASSLTLNGINTFSGGTTLNAGTLTLGTGASLGSGALTVIGASTLDNAAPLVLANNLNVNANLALAGNNNLTLGGVITGAGTLTKNGASNLTLSGSNNFLGGTTLNAGTLTAASNLALGLGNLTVGGTSTLDNTSPLVLANNINVNANLALAGNNSLSLGGVIAGTGTLTKNGLADVTLSGNNTFSGTFDVLAGSLNTLSSGALGNNATVTLAAGAALNLGTSGRLATLTGSGTALIGTGTTLSLGGNNISSTFAGILSGDGGMTKLGTGTLTLGGISDLTGDTLVNAGTLQVNGSLASGNVRVNNGGTLGGSGTLAGAVTVADSGHLAGATGSTLSVGSLVFKGNSNFNVGLGTPVSGGGNGLVNVGGSLTLDGTLNVRDIGGFGSGVYRLMNYTGGLTDNGMLIGTVPGSVTRGDLMLQTGQANQINLLVTTPGVAVQFWDGNQLIANGSVDGGSGIWDTSTPNWTDVNGKTNQVRSNNFAVFQGAAGTVTVNSAQTITGMQFATDGYSLVNGAAGSLSLVNGELGNATVRVDPNATATVGTALNGSATLGKYDRGTLVLNAANGYTGGTALNGGKIVVGNNAALGTGALTAADSTVLDSNVAVALGNNVVLNGALNVTGSNALTLGGVVSGTGSLIKSGASSLTLNGNNSYSGGTLLNGGTLVLGNNAALGSGALVFKSGTTLDSSNTASLFNAVDLDGSLTLAGSHDLTLSGVISGNGDLNKLGASTLTLSGNNTFNGSLNVLNGSLTLIGNTGLGNADLSVGSGASVSISGLNNLDALSGSGALMLASGSTLQMGEGGTSSVYEGSINGDGQIVKAGIGKQELNGQSTVGGGTRVLAGSLIVGSAAGSTASLASDIDVAKGAMLGGHGTVIGDINLASGATLNPGNSIGTLKVNGDLRFNSGSTLVIEANPDGRSDRVIASGSVALDGANLSVLASTGSWAPNTPYNIIQANNLTGTFGSVSSNLAFLMPLVSYASNGATLNLARNDVAFASVAQTYNQRAVAGSLDSASSGAVHDAVAAFSADQARAAYNSLSGEIHPSTRGALFNDSRYVRDVIGTRLRSAQVQPHSEGVLHVDVDSNMTFWVNGYGSWGDSDSDGNSNVADLDHNSQGMLMGVDMPLNDTWRAGVAAGYGNTDLDANARNSSAKINSTSLTAYLGGQWDALHLRTGVSHAWNKVESSRHVQVGSLQEHVKADYDASTHQVFAELGYDVQVGNLALEPFAGLAHVEVDSDSFREQGGSTSLSGDSEKDRATYSSLGLRARTASAEVAGVPLSVQSSLAWQRVLDEPGESSRLSLNGYDSFTVKGVPVAQDTALVQLGVSARLAPQASLDLGYSGQIGDGYSDHGVRLGLNIAF